MQNSRIVYTMDLDNIIEIKAEEFAIHEQYFKLVEAATERLENSLLGNILNSMRILLQF